MNKEEFNLDKELKEIRELNEKLEERKQQEWKKKEFKKNLKEGAAVVGVSAAILGSAAGIASCDKTEIPESKPARIEIDDDIILTRYYKTEFGDTLTALSNETGITVKDIVRDNFIDNPNEIYPNQRIELNYKVSEEDLKYYTEEASTNGKNINELAQEYETSCSTIYHLNEEDIVLNSDGTYTINSDTIIVPNFITPEELEEAKQEVKTK